MKKVKLTRLVVIGTIILLFGASVVSAINNNFESTDMIDGIEKFIEIDSDIIILRPNGQGDSSELSTFGDSYGWKCVDESTPNGYTDYVYADNYMYSWDLYELADPPSEVSGQIDKIIIYVNIIEEAPARWKSTVKIDGAKFDFPTEGGYVDYAWEYRTQEWPQNPNTQDSWTWENIKNLQAGIGIRARDYDGQKGLCTQLYVEVHVLNEPPSTPVITGQTSGKPGKSYIYSASSTDPNEDRIYYWFDWGDGSNTGWTGPYDSGDTASESHVWDVEGNYIIKVKAKDYFDDESNWGTLEITMPKNKEISYNFGTPKWLFECFQNKFLILRQQQWF